MFKNYAGQSNVDDEIEKELVEARINVIKLPERVRDSHPEMRTIIMGSLHGWSFKRAWRYWIATGPGIEVCEAERLHADYGKEVRVDGHCGCPSPREQFRGLACGHYHVDSQRGLNALAATINKICDKSREL